MTMRTNGRVSFEKGALTPGFSTARGAAENLKYYERTQHLIESIDIPFLELSGTQHLIEKA